MKLEFILMYILLIHFLADFALQTYQQAVNKSTDVVQLAYHCLVYSFIWGLAIMTFPIKDFNVWLLFVVYTFGTHYITDYWTSRLGKPYWDAKDLHNGFVIVGMDQIIHYVTIYISFKYILQIF